MERSGPGAEASGGPPPLRSFDDLRSAAFNVPLWVLANVQRCGYAKPTPIQVHALPLALDGRGLHSSILRLHVSTFSETHWVFLVDYGDKNGSGRAERWTTVSPCWTAATT
jgi:hypothetical protein